MRKNNHKTVYIAQSKIPLLKIEDTLLNISKAPGKTRRLGGDNNTLSASSIK